MQIPRRIQNLVKYLRLIILRKKLTAFSRYLHLQNSPN